MATNCASSAAESVTAGPRSTSSSSAYSSRMRENGMTRCCALGAAAAAAASASASAAGWSRCSAHTKSSTVRQPSSSVSSLRIASCTRSTDGCSCSQRSAE